MLRFYFSSLVFVIAICFFGEKSFAQETVGKVATTGASNSVSEKQDASKGLGVLEVQSLREPLPIDLGAVVPGTTRRFRMSLKNNLGVDLFPLSISRDCNCINANVPSIAWRDKESLDVELQISFGISLGTVFRQKLTILDRNKAIAPLILDVSGKVLQPLALDSSLIVVEEMGHLAKKDLIIRCLSDVDDVSQSSVESSISGLQLVIKERSTNALVVSATLDSEVAFRGRPSISGIVLVRNFLRDGKATDHSLYLEIRYTKIIVPVPERITFFKSNGRYVGKVLLYGDFSKLPRIDGGVPPNARDEIVVRANWGKESGTGDLEVSSTLLKPNVVSVNVFSQKPISTSTSERFLNFRVGMKGAGISVPAEFLDLDIETDIILQEGGR